MKGSVKIEDLSKAHYWLTAIGKRGRHQHATWDKRKTLCGRPIPLFFETGSYSVLGGTRPDCAICREIVEQRAVQVAGVTGTIRRTRHNIFC